jgi:hypothetical protein
VPVTERILANAAAAPLFLNLYLYLF